MPKVRLQKPLTLSIDIGGSKIKAAVLDARGRLASPLVKRRTPKLCKPGQLIEEVRRLIGPLKPAADRVSAGFPGVVRGGTVLTAPNLSNRAWSGFRLDRALERLTGKPARVMNDADMQGLAVIREKGLELVLTLGTGVGTSIFYNGWLLPHIELGIAYHPVKKGRTYNEYIGDEVRRQKGVKRWSRRVRRVIGVLEEMTTYDRLYLGGGNAKKIRFKLEPNMRIVPNRAGVLGGIMLWTKWSCAAERTPACGIKG